MDNNRPGHVSRRWALTAGALALAPFPAKAEAVSIKALAFDAFPIFDPRGLIALARELFPKQGEALVAAWTAKLFGYTWLSTAAETYQDFATLADASLRFAAETSHLEMKDSERVQLVAKFGQLDVWPDVKPVLEKLKAADIRLCFLSNLGEATLRSNMQRAGINEFFDAVLSTDRVRRFKPSPTAYRMAPDALQLPKRDIGFIAFGGWDAIGATWFGYKTAWINRMDVPAERLDARPAVVSHGIEGALQLAGLT